VFEGCEGELVMAGKVFIDNGYSCRSAVDQNVASYGFVTGGEFPRDDEMLSFHSYIEQT